MKVVITVLMIIGAFAVMYRYNPTAEKELEVGAGHRNLGDEKSEVMQELEKLNHVVKKQLDHIGSKTPAANHKMDEAIANTKKRLLVEQNNITEAMRRVRQSSENKWDDVKEDMTDKITDMRIEIARVSEKIKNEIDVNNKSK